MTEVKIYQTAEKYIIEYNDANGELVKIEFDDELQVTEYYNKTFN